LPANEFNIGSDWTIDLFDPLQGGVQTFSLITGFSKRQTTNRVTSRGLDGIRRDYDIPDGWEGTLTFDRASPALDAYFAAREQAHYDGQVIPPCSITETIREVGGGITQWRYENVTLAMSQGGEARGDAKVEMTVDFVSSRRRRVI
jgi:hypothetical protein